MRIPEDKVEEVRAATDILGVVQGYVAMKKKGQNWFGFCPWHAETSPSFSVHPGRQIFHCFSCGRGGNVFGFLMEVERVTFTEAVKMMAERAGIALPEYRSSAEEGEVSEAEELSRINGLVRDYFYRQLTESHSDGAEEARRYLTARGYGKEVIDRYLLGYAPDSWDSLVEFGKKNGLSLPLMTQAGLLKEGKEKGRPYDAFRHRIMFPIRNLAGRVIAFGGRRLREDGDEAKYINSPESAVYRKGRELFGLWEARDQIRKSDAAILVEGYTDCLSLVMAGVNVAVASLGTALTENQARLLKRFTGNVFILYDGDSAGLSAARRAIDVILGAGATPRVIVLPAEEDPDSFVRKFGGEAVWQLRNEKALSPTEFQMHMATRGKASKSDAARELVASAALIASPIEQDAFLQEIAAKTGISLEALRREMTRTHLPQREIEKLPPREKWPPPGTLSSLAKVLVRRPELRPVVFAEWSPEAVEDPRMRALLDHLYNEWFRDEIRESDTLLDRFPDSPVREFIVECIDDEELDSDTSRKVDEQLARDCLRVLKADTVKSEISVLKQRLRESPDDAELLRGIQTLAQQEKELRIPKAEG